ncbi:uncharacterized protein LOC114527091 [Dendronephthya gigantea]|uniref:uncharacterized protein LOC114527091 n=1 Tax=Dendronephthya gigantea TaxID=151771 RepID=UPI001068EE0D|nr:uncharacterized protein LOC114527091 [Dendronephthya gigantea]
MARFRCQNIFTIILAAWHLISFIIIWYLIQENVILKQSIIDQAKTFDKRGIVARTISAKSHLETTEKGTTLINAISTKFRTTTNAKLNEPNKGSKTYPIRLITRRKKEQTSPPRRKKEQTSPAHIQKQKFTISMLTVLVFKSTIQDFKGDLNKTVENIQRLYPTVQILNNNESINSMISRVKTQYFLLVEDGVSLSSGVNESIEMLWNALQQFPEIDFIGGSYLAGEKLHVACYHYRLCRWMFSESYEYKRSLGNVMICDGTSFSFMGRRESVKKMNGFDSQLPNTLVIKDFFLRAKQNKNAVVGTIANVMFLVDNYSNSYRLWQSKGKTRELVPFAVKHKIFIFKDSEGTSIDLCSEASPLRGKDLCDEKKAHDIMLNGGHWAYKGVFAYPYILKYLEITMSEVTKFFEEQNVSYIVIGGVSLGAVKMRSILPWEAGDIDVRVYGMSLVQLLKLMEPWAKKNDYLIETHMSTAVHIYCTPREVGRVSGGLATIYPYKHKTSPDYIRIRTNGIWVRYDRHVFKQFLEYYGEDFLQHKVYRRNEIISCKIKEHNACLPNFTSLYQGRVGTLSKFYCQN